jgi:C4-dicarboxylate-specific signal transduction histidine kinase
LLILLANAKDAILTNKPSMQKINVDISSNENSIEICVQDSGGGISHDIVDKIFDPYFSTKNLNGLGIGLYMAKEIIERYLHGVIQVENCNTGAKFTIKI